MQMSMGKRFLENTFLHIVHSYTIHPYRTALQSQKAQCIQAFVSFTGMYPPLEGSIVIDEGMRAMSSSNRPPRSGRPKEKGTSPLPSPGRVRGIWVKHGRRVGKGLEHNGNWETPDPKWPTTVGPSGSSTLSRLS